MSGVAMNMHGILLILGWLCGGGAFGLALWLGMRALLPEERALPPDWRLPGLVAAAAMVALTAFAEQLAGLGLAMFIVAASTLLAVSAVDLRWHIIPDSVLGAGSAGLLVVWGLAAAEVWAGKNPAAVPTSPARALAMGLAGMLFLGGLLFAVHVASGGRGLGMGDVKLGGFIGLLLGPLAGLWALFWGALAGAMAAVLMLGLRWRRMGDAIPYGPFLALGAIIVLCTSGSILLP